MSLQKIILAFCLLGSLAMVSCRTVDHRARMEQVVQYYSSNNQFMGSVLVARDQTLLLNESYGFANLEWEIPNSLTTKFRLGSVTKQFTAACVFILEDRGVLKVDNAVKTYMPNAPAAWDKVTIYNLLTHTSGIPNLTSFPGYQDKEGIFTTPEQLVSLFLKKPLDFASGEKASYSNSNYILLGYLIEKISGESYEKFVADNIFTPLGMNDSGYDVNSAIIPRRAAGYSSDLRNAKYIDMSTAFSAGGLYSTTQDLLLWEQGLFGGKLLSPASLQKMVTPFKKNFACGFFVNAENGRKVIEHRGGIVGFRTELRFFPDEKLTVAVLANIERYPTDIATKLAAVAHGEKVILPSERQEIALPSSIIANYVGSYELERGVMLEVTLENGQLMVQESNQSKFAIFAQTESQFFAKDPDAQIEFFKNANGEVSHLVIHELGRDRKANRK